MHENLLLSHPNVQNDIGLNGGARTKQLSEMFKRRKFIVHCTLHNYAFDV